MLCSLSGQVPQEPVVVVKSGLVFEKRLLLKYLEQNQRRCPVTNDEIDPETDLLPLRFHSAGASSSSSAEKAPTSTPLEGASIPQLLGLFQSEWDAAMLETFALKKHLEQTRQELSHALYQHDAACRVIARLNAENAALREKLAARASPQTDEEDVDMAADGLPAEVVATVEAKQKELAKRRKDFKKREAPRRAEWLAGIGEWALKSTHTLHDADKPGVLAVATDAKKPERVATAGVDKHVKVFNTQRQQLEATLAGHGKKVAAVEFHPSADLIVTGAHDKTLRLWTRADDDDAAYRVGATFDGYEDAVAALSIHPTGNYVLGGALDATWGFHDVRAGKLLARYALSGEVAAGATAKSVNETRSVRFHPDGGIFGTAAKSKLVQMWAVNSLANVVTFEGHAAPVNALAFSENGYHLASGADDGVVKLWDLRKAASFFEIDLSGDDKKKKTKTSAAVRALQFDPSGTFLAVGAGNTVQVLHEQSKNNWGVVQTFDEHKAAVTGVAFAADGSYLASASMDRALKLFR